MALTAPASYLVDRQARDKAAALLVAYLRREINNFTFDDELSAIETDDRAVRDISFALWCTYDDLKSHYATGNRQWWDASRRVLAFLKSDLPELPQSTDRRRWWKLPVGLLALTVIGIACWRAATDSPAWLLLPGLVLGVPWVIVMHFPRRAAVRNAYFPFMDEQQWRQYEHLLDSEHLPPFDEMLYDVPLRSRIEALMVLPGYVLFPLGIAPLLALLFLRPRHWR